MRSPASGLQLAHCRPPVFHSGLRVRGARIADGGFPEGNLVAMKNKYDPKNVLQSNQNIRPTRT